MTPWNVFVLAVLLALWGGGRTSNDTGSADRQTDRASYYQITFVCATYAPTRHPSIQTIFPKQLRFWSYNQFYRILGMYTICSPSENPSAMNMLDWEYWKGERGSNTQHKKLTAKWKEKENVIIFAVWLAFDAWHMNGRRILQSFFYVWQKYLDGYFWYSRRLVRCDNDIFRKE